MPNVVPPPFRARRVGSCTHQNQPENGVAAPRPGLRRGHLRPLNGTLAITVIQEWTESADRELGNRLLPSRYGITDGRHRSPLRHRHHADAGECRRAPWPTRGRRERRPYAEDPRQSASEPPPSSSGREARPVRCRRARCRTSSRCRVLLLSPHRGCCGAKRAHVGFPARKQPLPHGTAAVQLIRSPTDDGPPCLDLGRDGGRPILDSVHHPPPAGLRPDRDREHAHGPAIPAALPAPTRSGAVARFAERTRPLPLFPATGAPSGTRFGSALGVPARESRRAGPRPVMFSACLSG